MVKMVRSELREFGYFLHESQETVPQMSEEKFCYCYSAVKKIWVEVNYSFKNMVGEIIVRKQTA